MAKDAQGHGSDGQGGAKTEEQKDREFVAKLSGMFQGDKAAAQALASQFGNKSVIVDLHNGAGGHFSAAASQIADHMGQIGKSSQEVASATGKAIPHAPAGNTERGKSSFSAPNRQAGFKLALQEIHRQKSRD